MNILRNPSRQFDYTKLCNEIVVDKRVIRPAPGRPPDVRKTKPVPDMSFDNKGSGSGGAMMNLASGGTLNDSDLILIDFTSDNLPPTQSPPTNGNQLQQQQSILDEPIDVPEEGMCRQFNCNLVLSTVMCYVNLLTCTYYIYNLTPLHL